MDMTPVHEELTVAERIERSSLGTPAARKLRARTPSFIARSILRLTTGQEVRARGIRRLLHRSFASNRTAA